MFFRDTSIGGSIATIKQLTYLATDQTRHFFEWVVWFQWCIKVWSNGKKIQTGLSVPCVHHIFPSKRVFTAQVMNHLTDFQPIQTPFTIAWRSHFGFNASELIFCISKIQVKERLCQKIDHFACLPCLQKWINSNARSVSMLRFFFAFLYSLL